MFKVKIEDTTQVNVSPCIGFILTGEKKEFKVRVKNVSSGEYSDPSREQVMFMSLESSK